MRRMRRIKKHTMIRGKAARCEVDCAVYSSAKTGWNQHSFRGGRVVGAVGDFHCEVRIRSQLVEVWFVIEGISFEMRLPTILYMSRCEFEGRNREVLSSR